MNLRLEITPDLVLSHETVLEIIRKKVEHLQLGHFLFILPMHIPREKKCFGRLGKYSTIKFGVTHPMMQHSTHVLKCFVKMPPTSDCSEHSLVRNLGLFKREVDVYSIVFSNILKPEDTEIVPKYLHGEKNRILILEDMESINYVTVNKFKDLDFFHCCTVLQAMARFHARSIIYEENKSGYSLLDDCEIVWNVKLQLRPYDILMRQYLTGIAYSLSEAFEFIPQLVTRNYQKFKSEFRKIIVNFFETITAEDFSEMRVLCHSDLQASNLMFRYNDHNEPILCCMLDFQFVKYSSLSYDVWSFLYLNTTRELRDERVADFQKVYHDAFCTWLNEEQLEAAQIFPYSAFENIMETDRVYGLIQGILTLYYELRETIKSKFGSEHREVLKKIWMNSPELLHKDFDEFLRYKHRILQGVLELYPMVMVYPGEYFWQN